MLLYHFGVVFWHFIPANSHTRKYAELQILSQINTVRIDEMVNFIMIYAKVISLWFGKNYMKNISLTFVTSLDQQEQRVFLCQ